jgi:general transcription factor 3C polypeptide 3 (transcription factor C subunit 4)
MEPSGRESQTGTLDTHQGISFDDWLSIFLDYAIGLAITYRREEAYQVCEAAKDSTVFQTPNHQFIIHVAWSGT